MCRCAFNIASDKITGLCFSGLCKVSYWGHGCQLDDKCFYNQQPKKYMGMQSSTKSNISALEYKNSSRSGVRCGLFSRPQTAQQLLQSDARHGRALVLYNIKKN
ncbi:unnamed protein product [Lymnaea stagnalis]|uniref:Uncharacterized protein n=1 Tax=Lymnaea stagnalis TaxID=6523 RepID=A0AAV2HSR7_LYMST